MLKLQCNKQRGQVQCHSKSVIKMSSLSLLADAFFFLFFFYQVQCHSKSVIKMSSLSLLADAFFFFFFLSSAVPF